jgi:hypothetical protein
MHLSNSISIIRTAGIESNTNSNANHLAQVDLFVKWRKQQQSDVASRGSPDTSGIFFSENFLRENGQDAARSMSSWQRTGKGADR